MDKVKILAVAAVAIIIVAAAAIVLTQSDNEDEEKINLDAQLRVFGNANGDYTIDKQDLETIDKIINNELKASDYPFADADHNNTINEDDKALVQKIINGESCTVFHMNTCNTGDYVVDTKWPIKSAIATGASNMLSIMTMAGMDEMIHGITYSKGSPPDACLFPEFSKMTSIGSSSSKLPLDEASKYISKYNCTAAIVDKTASTVDKDTLEIEYEKMGVDIVRINPAFVDANRFSSEMLLLGFLFQTSEKCVDVAQWWIDLQEYIDEKTKDIEKNTVIATNGTESKGRIWVSAGTSDYVDVVVKAGGTYALGDEVLTDYTSGAYFNANDTWIYDYDIDNIICIKTNDWYSGTVSIDEKFAKSFDIFNKTESYKNKGCVMVTGDAPIPLRVAYSAVAMYPDIFTEEWADGLNKEFVTQFMPNNNVDWNKDLFFMITQDMLKA